MKNQDVINRINKHEILLFEKALIKAIKMLGKKKTLEIIMEYIESKRGK